MNAAWRKILSDARASLIALGLAILLTLGMIFGSDYFENEWQQELQTANNQVISLKSQIAQKQQDLGYLESNIARFRTLREHGLLSEPKREALIEQLVSTQKNRSLPETLSYALPPTQLMPSATSAPPIPGIETSPDPNTPHMHDIEFSIAQIHEGELLRLINDFIHETHGRFRVQSCQLRDPTPQGLSAQCTLRSFTLPPPTDSTPAS